MPLSPSVPEIASESCWQTELAQALRSADDLCRAGLIAPAEVAALGPVLSRYKFLLTPYYAGLIDRNNPRCPIRRQAIPAPVELEESLGLVADPLADLQHQPASRITHRYPTRALLHLTSNCSMYCRFCFRKSLLNELRSDLFGGELDEALGYIASHSEIEEVIFSGGDPLMGSDATLRVMLQRLAELRHLQRVRFHTRVPVTFPQRITARLVETLTSHRLPVVVVTHFNHPRELTGETARGARLLRDAGVTLLNQSVLLAGVNDDSETLCSLSRGLLGMGVLPYYLHHPDRAAGTAHFDVEPSRGLAIVEEMKTVLPGYLVPRYVVDVVGHPYKPDVMD